VLSRSEALAVLEGIEGVPLLVASLLNGSGLRLMEALGMRAKDLEFGRRAVLLGDGNRAIPETLPIVAVVPCSKALLSSRHALVAFSATPNRLEAGCKGCHEGSLARFDLR